MSIEKIYYEMDEMIYCDILSGRCGHFPQRELAKLLFLCMAIGDSFYLTDEGKKVKKII